MLQVKPTEYYITGRREPQGAEYCIIDRRQMRSPRARDDSVDRTRKNWQIPANRETFADDPRPSRGGEANSECESAPCRGRTRCGWDFSRVAPAPGHTRTPASVSAVRLCRCARSACRAERVIARKTRGRANVCRTCVQTLNCFGRTTERLRREGRERERAGGISSNVCVMKTF